MAQTATRLPRLPACTYCSHRKTKCDNKRPKCAACARSGSQCEISLPSGEVIAREYIHELEEQERLLNGTTLDQNTPIQEQQPVVQDSPETVTTVRSAGTALHFVEGEGNGLSFMRSLFKDTEWRESNSDLLQNFSTTSTGVENATKANPLPDANEVREMLELYLNFIHIQTPFLLRQDLQALYHRVYPSDLEARSIKASSHDMFQIFMIVAISSVTLYRSGSHQAHPLGYYIAALEYFDKSFLSSGLSGIQDLLLIGRFGIYHHIGTSIWDITHLAVRMCLEQELHRKPSVKLPLLQEQLQRRVFWECYRIDRYSSITLNRPFAVAEREIDVNLPVKANDEEITAAQSIYPDLDAFCTNHFPQGNNEMSVFIVCIQLRKITSSIQAKSSEWPNSDSLSTEQSLLVTGQLYSDLNELLQDLDLWRNSVPVFLNPRCLYERREWFDLIYFRERFTLIRKALDMVPKRRGLPPRDLLDLCLETSINSILTFVGLYQQKRISNTRSYFQTLFMAGLSIMFCLSTHADVRRQAVAAPLNALNICGETLRTMAMELPDAKYYPKIFEALHHKIAKKFSAPVTPSPSGHPFAVPEQSSNPESIGAQVYYFSQDAQPDKDSTGGSNNNLTEHNRSSHFSQNNDLYRDQYAVPMYSSSDADLGTSQNNGMPRFAMDNDDSVDDILQWAFLNDDIVWDLEAGLGEYAYGNPMVNSSVFNPFYMDT